MVCITGFSWGLFLSPLVVVVVFSIIKLFLAQPVSLGFFTFFCPDCPPHPTGGGMSKQLCGTQLTSEVKP